MVQAHKDAADTLNDTLVARLKLRQLALLQKLAQQGSLSRVAQAMRLSQPAITQALREIETLFGTPLFARGSRGLAPTPAGEVALAHARTALAGLEATARELAALEAGRHARLRVGVIPHLPMGLLDAMLQALLAASPRNAVMLREGTSDELVTALRAGELDWAIGRPFYDSGDADIQVEPLYEQRPSLLVPAASRARLARAAADLRQLADLDWILPPPRTPIRRSVNAMFARAGIAPPSPLLETYSLKSIEAVLARQPRAIALLAHDVGADLAARGAAALLPCALQWDLPPISLLSLAGASGARLSPQAVQALSAAVARMPGQRDARAAPAHA
ncbi:LysR family transcriptional regulator [Ramlibacter rhizophilus]|uniref:LysR family transcriptional regulator n=1 Tax=Ramlibacter rhizophilus TaxID=1781167 RepID=A0A4Z0BP55_9BURK|nr:LysR family transcriptional regulator [Ramlibacter rhizophilus]TFY99834.1 LysR family transcriptional regulator [Ramlibacter rhizophilus]